jgi:hypothetical protein
MKRRPWKRKENKPVTLAMFACGVTGFFVCRNRSVKEIFKEV